MMKRGRRPASEKQRKPKHLPPAVPVPALSPAPAALFYKAVVEYQPQSNAPPRSSKATASTSARSPPPSSSSAARTARTPSLWTIGASAILVAFHSPGPSVVFVEHPHGCEGASAASSAGERAVAGRGVEAEELFDCCRCFISLGRRGGAEQETYGDVRDMTKLLLAQIQATFDPNEKSDQEIGTFLIHSGFPTLLKGNLLVYKADYLRQMQIWGTSDVKQRALRKMLDE